MNKKEKLIELQRQKKILEEQIEELNSQLQFYYDKGFNKSLIDDEGFPKADLDFGELVTYKNLRREFNEKNNDHIEIMKQIENSIFIVYQDLIQYHQDIQNDPNVANQIEQYTIEWKKKQQQQQQTQNNKSEIVEQQQKQVNNIQNKQETQNIDKQNEKILKPFAYIEDILKDSPAECAGFKQNDYILKFGMIDQSNHNKLLNLYEYIKNQENKSVNVKILRPIINKKIEDFDNESYMIFDLKITPKAWSGKGLLGWKMIQL